MDGWFSHVRQVAVHSISNTRFLGPTAVHVQNGISIGSAVLTQLTVDSPFPSKLPQTGLERDLFDVTMQRRSLTSGQNDLR